MDAKTILTLTVRPTLALMGARYQGQPAERLLVAIAMQESGLRARTQLGGPARGLWQFEKAGVASVLMHPATANAAGDLCSALIYSPVPTLVHAAIADNDQLACGIARLLIFTHPRPLPDTPDEGWAQYTDLWRPGKPRPETWAQNWAAANEAAH